MSKTWKLIYQTFTFSPINTSLCDLSFIRHLFPERTSNTFNFLGICYLLVVNGCHDSQNYKDVSLRPFCPQNLGIQVNPIKSNPIVQIKLCLVEVSGAKLSASKVNRDQKKNWRRAEPPAMSLMKLFSLLQVFLLWAINHSTKSLEPAGSNTNKEKEVTHCSYRHVAFTDDLIFPQWNTPIIIFSGFFLICQV